MFILQFATGWWWEGQCILWCKVPRSTSVVVCPAVSAQLVITKSARSLQMTNSNLMVSERPSHKQVHWLMSLCAVRRFIVFSYNNWPLRTKSLPTASKPTLKDSICKPMKTLNLPSFKRNSSPKYPLQHLRDVPPLWAVKRVISCGGIDRQSRSQWSRTPCTGTASSPHWLQTLWRTPLKKQERHVGT